jgi:hypothetical protein
MLESKRDYEGAILELRESTRLDPSLMSAWANLGRLLLATPDLDGAIDAYSRAVSRAPGRGLETMLGLGLLLAGRPDDALPMLSVPEPATVRPQLPPEERQALLAECRRMIELKPYLSDPDALPECAPRDYLYSGSDWSILHTWKGTPAFILGRDMMSMAGDVDGDGRGDLLLGYADNDGAAGADSGVLHLVSGANFRVLTTWEGEQAGSRFGLPPSGAGDLDGDGLPDQLTAATMYDGIAGADCGKVYAFQGNDLYLNVEPAVASAGDTVTLTTTAGVPGNFVIDVVTELDSLPMFLLLTPVLTFDSNGELVISGDVPLGLGAHDVKLQSYAIGRSGKLIDSSTRTLTLQ